MKWDIFKREGKKFTENCPPQRYGSAKTECLKRTFIVP
jgi:hypothetical protein